MKDFEKLLIFSNRMSIFTQHLLNSYSLLEQIMSTIYFISDAHLGFDKNRIDKIQEKRLLDFLEFIRKNGTTLFIVGDLFDFWFEYRYVIPSQYFKILASLKKCTSDGVKIEYLTGNHDFCVNDFFKDELGISVYNKPYTTTIGGKKYFISHGDGILKNDTGYKILKKILRLSINIRLYRLLHPDIGFALAGFFSRLSRDHRLIKDNDEEYISFVKTLFADGYDGVVMGHTHRPMEYRENNHTYINIGDWIRWFSYGKLENGQLSLEYWPKI
jgi:UDP-2,3-diacylglucosamine hydrolase